jgi:hypothetical protein
VSFETKSNVPQDASQEKRRMAKLMLAKNYPIEEISLLTGLSAAEIKGL